MQKPVRIISPGFNFLGEIDDYASFILYRRWHKWGRFELHIAIDKQNTDMLQQDNMVFLGTDYNNVGIIEHREVGLDEDGTEMLLIKGYSLQKITDRKIILPPAGQTHESYTNQPAESVIKGYINNSMVNPTDLTRKAPNVFIATDKGRGNSLTWESRHKPLDEEIIKLSESSGLGWNIGLDIDNEKLIFDVYEGRDLTAGQDINPPAIFSVDFDNILSQSYQESTIGHKNVAYVAGQGEGTERVVKQVGDATGLGRREMFVDARDLEDEDKLIPRGEQKLSEFEKIQALESQILTNSNLIYKKDYDLGDIVTVQNKKWGVTMDARITEIREIYEESGFRLEADFGNAIPTLIDKVKQEVANASVMSEGGGGGETGPVAWDSVKDKPAKFPPAGHSHSEYALVSHNHAELQYLHSNRDFGQGTLIQTDIIYTHANANPFLLEIGGNSYGAILPFAIKVQGYIYGGSIINHGGISLGGAIGGLVAFSYNGLLCFWFPRQQYWQGFSVFVSLAVPGIKKNTVVAISDSVKPVGATREVAITLREPVFK